MTQPRILVAGIGNIFLGDDAFGVEVARALMVRPLLAGVRVCDFGIRGLDLAYALMDGFDRVILVDALPRGGAPGTLYVLAPDSVDADGSAADTALLDAHTLNPLRVLSLVRALGGQCPPLVVVGCEPATLGSAEEPALGLSEPVQAAVGAAAQLIVELVENGTVPCASN